SGRDIYHPGSCSSLLHGLAAVWKTQLKLAISFYWAILARRGILVRGF
ncbi:hypothetical protein THAOC_35966, partial [Thalassiosira oceanica]